MIVIDPEKTKKKVNPLISRTRLGGWNRQESNLRPPRCERDILPIELRPLLLRIILFVATSHRSKKKNQQRGSEIQHGHGRNRT